MIEHVDAPLPTNPIEGARRWVAHAIETGQPEPTALALATADAAARPSVRFVLLKEILDDGLLFATNYGSRKALELHANPFAAGAMHWPGLERQLRFEGPVERATDEESDRIFAARPRNARVGAWASRQSLPLDHRATLDQRVERFRRQFGEEVPRPEFWGAYRIAFETVEFWCGRADRLHDRRVFRLDSTGVWSVGRLQP